MVRGSGLLFLTGAVIYICGDEEGRTRIRRRAEDVGLWDRLRIETLDFIKTQTREGFEEAKREGSKAA
jgi:hypothetical protein